MEFKSPVYISFQSQREKRINILIDFLEKWHAYDIFIEVHCTNIFLKRNHANIKDVFKTLYLPNVIHDIVRFFNI